MLGGYLNGATCKWQVVLGEKKGRAYQRFCLFSFNGLMLFLLFKLPSETYKTD